MLELARRVAQRRSGPTATGRVAFQPVTDLQQGPVVCQVASLDGYGRIAYVCAKKQLINGANAYRRASCVCNRAVCVIQQVGFCVPAISRNIPPSHVAIMRGKGIAGQLKQKYPRV